MPGGDQGPAQRRAHDGADPADAGRHAERGAAHLGRVEVADEGVDQHLGAEDEDAGEQHGGVHEQLVVHLDREQRQEHRGQPEPQQHGRLVAARVREAAGYQQPDDRADVEDQQQTGAGLDRVAGLAHDLRQPGVEAVDQQQPHERRDADRDRDRQVAAAEDGTGAHGDLGGALVAIGHAVQVGLATRAASPTAPAPPGARRRRRPRTWPPTPRRRSARAPAGP